MCRPFLFRIVAFLYDMTTAEPCMALHLAVLYSHPCETRVAPALRPTVPCPCCAADTDPSCAVADVCLARQPCLNGATCRRQSGPGFSCLCPPAWSGRLCQLERDPCPSQRDVCGAGFNCSRSEASPAGFTCHCRGRPGWAKISGDRTINDAMMTARHAIS